VGKEGIVHLESDTCDWTGLANIFDSNLGGRSLAARGDRALGLHYGSRRSPTDLAACRLVLALEAYFNSGVMDFDSTHPNVKSGLDQAINGSPHESDRFTFHDQCALNLVFVGKVARLDSTYRALARCIRSPWQRLKPWHDGSTSRAAVAHWIVPT